ncbi:serine/threonine-protein kinase AtPK2/AtPK19-like protein [Anopheles sinensis]|uniref:Serine/threonine-protein kinase AtPK2/AtPK19-like protein n=1 Tax=Anopheles sinensis TaxID=74873 RepID=A0A084VIT4_ANOSI|nr:serine/threonine-protein kinase AtPK2/AtPK19-like protein [Anopheles sinensis]
MVSRICSEVLSNWSPVMCSEVLSMWIPVMWGRHCRVRHQDRWTKSRLYFVPASSCRHDARPFHLEAMQLESNRSQSIQLDRPSIASLCPVHVSRPESLPRCASKHEESETERRPARCEAKREKQPIPGLAGK